MKAFVSVMDNYTPLSEDVCVLTDHDEPIVVDEESIAKNFGRSTYQEREALTVYPIGF